jgi:hypothetical protein
MIGVLSRDEALSMAEDEGLDLVEIQPNADPPVCRIMDFGKFRFEQQKKAAAAKKKQKVVEIKEVKFRPDDRRWRLRDQAAQPAPLPRRRRPGEDHDPLQGSRNGAYRTRSGHGATPGGRSKGRSHDRTAAETRRSPDDHDGGAQEEVGRRKFSPQGEPERRPDAGFHPDPGNRINKPM